MTIQAIETKYKGYRFRSRLEARWAVFFDALGIEWEYEKEGYILPQIIGKSDFQAKDDLASDLHYLPDFWLPKLNIFVEVKGEEPNDVEILKATRLSYFSNKHVLLVGAIPIRDEYFTGCKNDGDYKGYYFYTFGGLDLPYFFCESNCCGQIDVHWEACSDRINCCEKNRTGTKENDHFSKRLTKAYDAARSARFEHGE
jgi:hypothetical protein